MRPILASLDSHDGTVVKRLEMQKPPAIPVIQFLNEVYQGRQPLEYYFKNWFSRLAKYRKDDETLLSNEKLLAKTAAVATSLYNERAKAWKRQLARELDDQDEYLLTFVDAWCYHWAMREGFLRQRAEKKSKPPKSDDLAKLDEETLLELAEGRTFNAKKINGKNARDFTKIFRSKLSRHEDNEDWKCDLWEDLVFVDLCRNHRDAFYPLFIDKYVGYFTKCLSNERKKNESLIRLRDDDFRIAVDDAFMATIGLALKGSNGRLKDEGGENEDRESKRLNGKGLNGTYRGLCGLKNWVWRVLVHECISAVKSYPKGGDGDLDLQRSRDLDGLPLEDRELVEKYLKMFQETFSALPLAIQLALRIRFDHVLDHEKGRPITNVADFSDDDLSATAEVSGLLRGELKVLVKKNKTAIEKLVYGLFEDARREGLVNEGLKVLSYWALRTVGAKSSKDKSDESKQRE